MVDRPPATLAPLDPAALRRSSGDSRGGCEPVPGRMYTASASDGGTHVGIEIDWGSVVTSWREVDHGPTWIRCRLEGASPPAAEWSEAITVANAAGQPWPEGGDPDGLTEGGLTVDSADGRMIFLHRATTGRSLRRWVEAFSTSIASAGLRGSLGGAISARVGLWLDAPPSDMVAAFVWRRAGRTDGPSTDRGALAAICGWAAAPGYRQSHVSHQSWGFEAGGLDAEGARTHLDPGTRAGSAALYLADDLLNGERMRYVDVSPRLLVTREIDPSTTAAEQAREIVTHLRRAGDDIDVAFVRQSCGYGDGFDYCSISSPVASYHFRSTPALLDRHVPDAHALQIVTGAHLERARDLSYWSVEEIAHDRYLVTTPEELEDWFGEGRPDRATLEEARHDFGRMIATEDDVRALPSS